MKKWMYVFLPLQVLLLLLSPRFGWRLHGPEATILSYKGISYIDGKFCSQYKNETDKLLICYKNIFSKQFTVMVNEDAEYYIKVGIDGKLIEGNLSGLPFTGSDLVWKDTFGILWWRCILTVAMTVLSIILIKRANRIQIWSCILYAASLLISLRIIF